MKMKIEEQNSGKNRYRQWHYHINSYFLTPLLSFNFILLVYVYNYFFFLSYFLFRCFFVCVCRFSLCCVLSHFSLLKRFRLVCGVSRIKQQLTQWMREGNTNHCVKKIKKKWTHSLFKYFHFSFPYCLLHAHTLIFSFNCLFFNILSPFSFVVVVFVEAFSLLFACFSIFLCSELNFLTCSFSSSSSLSSSLSLLVVGLFFFEGLLYHSDNICWYARSHAHI